MRDLWAEFKEIINKGSIVEPGVAFVLGVVFVGRQPNFGERGLTLNGSFIPVWRSNDYVGEPV